MKRTFSLIIIVCWVFAACQATPEESTVKSKKEDTFMESLATEEITEVNTPDDISDENRFSDYTSTWNQTVQVKPYNINVNIDAKVVTPHIDEIPVYEIEFERITQEQINNFLSQFGNAEFRLNSIGIHTKAYYEQLILDLKQYLAVDLPKKDVSESEKEAIRSEYNDSIKRLESIMSDAPESIDDIVEPIFTNKYLIMASEDENYADGENNINNDNYETAEEHYKKFNTDAIDIKWQDNGKNMTLRAKRSDDFSNEFLYKAGSGRAYSLNVIENTSDLPGFETTYSQAQLIAENAIDLLGADYMEISHNAKYIRYTDFNNAKYEDVSYVFYFTRSISSITETYCSNIVSYFDRYDRPWPYEKITVEVDDSGIKEICWESCTSKLGEKLSTDSSLMSFEEIMKIAENQLSVSNIAFNNSAAILGQNFENLSSMDLNIDEIHLGYARIKLSDNSGRYVIIPVWDFFGYFEADTYAQGNEVTINSKESDYNGMYRHSYLTINAIDGSIIDRTLGY